MRSGGLLKSSSSDSSGGYRLSSLFMTMASPMNMVDHLADSGQFSLATSFNFPSKASSTSPVVILANPASPRGAAHDGGNYDDGYCRYLPLVLLSTC